ncbi:MAG: hypothetical protein KY476_17625 [Planctomycetes bacterium]|nr:hypothetical protein [Planctomycetota bacterium]
MARSVSIVAFDLAAAEWQAVDQSIDDAFGELESRVLKARPDLTSRAERVQAARFHFNYRAFDPPAESENVEPLVVGIRFEPGDGGIHIAGDICTEESGRILYDERCEAQLAGSATEVAVVAGDIARRLAAQHGVILDYFGAAPQ